MGKSKAVHCFSYFRYRERGGNLLRSLVKPQVCFTVFEGKMKMAGYLDRRGTAVCRLVRQIQFVLDCTAAALRCGRLGCRAT